MNISMFCLFPTNEPHNTYIVILKFLNQLYVTLPISNTCNPPFLHLLSQQPQCFNDCFHNPHYIGTVLKLLGTAFSARLLSTIRDFT